MTPLRALTALLLIGPLLVPAVGRGATAAERSAPDPDPVPAGDYPLYDHLIATKFLTSQTRLVLIDRLTVTRLQPDGPPMSLRYFQDHPVLEQAVPTELLAGFVVNNAQPSRLEPRFNFGVRYRLVSGDETDGSEVNAGIPTQLETPNEAPATIGRLHLSRVSYSRNLALVYIAEERRDGTGGGLLFLLARSDGGWTVVDTDVLWMAQREPPARD